MINSITATAINYLRSIGISCSDVGVGKNIEEWHKNKLPLLELLRKHPLWREDELAIVTTINEKRDLDGRYFDYCDELRSVIYEKNDIAKQIIDKLSAPIIANHNGFLPDMFSTFFSAHHINDAALRFATDYCFAETISEYTADGLNQITPEFHFKPGQKSTRVLNRVYEYFGFTKHPSYNRIFAKICDCISPKTFKRTAVLSVNPMDYFTMSNGNSWSNCMCLVPSRNYDGQEYQGKHKAGCMSYLTDGVSLLFYTLDESDFKSKELWKIPKITRQVIFYNSPHLVHERIYPKSIDYRESETNPYIIYRNCVWKLISECESVGNSWYPFNTIIRDNPDTFMYPDWNYYTVLKYINPNLPKQGNTINVGGQTYCLKCGSHRYRTTHDINDRMCSSLFCEDCDPTITECERDDDDDDRDDDYYDDNDNW